MISRRSTFLLAVLAIVLGVSPSYVSAERGVAMPDYDTTTALMTDDLPLACGEDPDVKQMPKDKDKKKDKDKHKKDKHKKDKDKHKKKKKEEPKKKDKDSIATARTGRRPVSARHSPKGNRLSAIPTSNETATLDVEVGAMGAFDKPAASASIGIASA